VGVEPDPPPVEVSLQDGREGPHRVPVRGPLRWDDPHMGQPGGVPGILPQRSEK
jgi:hypothetical protein